MANKSFFICFATAVLLAIAACSTKSVEPQVEGHYTYEHAFNYDLNGFHFDVYETGTMDFCADSSALDSARQIYTVTRLKGSGNATGMTAFPDTVTFVFNYISPSRWSLDGDTFHFTGIKDVFRMELLEARQGKECEMISDEARDLAHEIINVVGGSIDYHYKFNLDSLTTNKMQWSFVYRDGHSDTWEFFRNNK